MKSITSKYAKNRRDELSKDITKYWTIIKNENIISKGTIRNYDLKVLLTKIQEMAEERILMKLYLQCINMGYKKFSDLQQKITIIQYFHYQRNRNNCFI